ncbi:metal-dependent hydrolase [bacterium]|nr:metal-dependent hydrolase [bacterium]
MDSISQFALGAAIGEATLGTRLGKKAMLIGGLLATLPDLDVLVRYADAVESYTYHRSWSHSLITLCLVSPFIAFLFHRYVPASWSLNARKTALQPESLTYPHWLLFVLLILVTHPILDGFTVYGTQLFWPLPVEPIAWGSVFIIDPLYTLPLIICLLIAYRSRSRARSAALIGLLLSTAYLAITLTSQQHARMVALASLEEQNLSSAHVLVAPAPLSVLWRIVSMDGDTYYEGFYSLLDQHKSISFAPYNSHRNIIDEQIDHWPIARLDWFTDGFISASRENNQLIINDLRMGVEDSYVFRFRVGAWGDTGLQDGRSELLPMTMNIPRITTIVKRAWDEDINVTP